MVLLNVILYSDVFIPFSEKVTCTKLYNTFLLLFMQMVPRDKIRSPYGSFPVFFVSVASCWWNCWNVDKILITLSVSDYHSFETQYVWKSSRKVPIPKCLTKVRIFTQLCFKESLRLLFYEAKMPISDGYGTIWKCIHTIGLLRH